MGNIVQLLCECVCVRVCVCGGHVIYVPWLITCENVLGTNVWPYGTQEGQCDVYYVQPPLTSPTWRLGWSAFQRRAVKNYLISDKNLIPDNSSGDFDIRTPEFRIGIIARD